MPDHLDPTDTDLLAAYTRDRDPTAFATLVRRHADLVYNACLRQTRGHHHLADDATQATFLLLAQRAHRLKPTVTLAGWLYTTARHAAANACRAETRRRRHEQKAATARLSSPKSAMPTTTLPADAHGTSLWHDLLPFLDPAVNALPTRDRDALLLRYFQAKPIRDVAAALNISEDAAKQRCSRAVEKLRRHFTARGLTTPAAALTTTLLAHTTTHAAPPAIISAVCGFALPTAVAPSISLIAGKTLLMTQLKSLATAAIAATLLVATGAAALLLAAPPSKPSPPPSPLASTSPTTAPATTNVAITDPVAAALVRELRAAESWIDTVKSFQLTAELTWLPPAPGVPPAASANFTEGTEKLSLGFDDHRLFYRADATGYRLIHRRTWDGKLAVIHEKYSPAQNNQEHYSLENNPWPIGQFFLTDLSWPRVYRHAYWWIDPAIRQVVDDPYRGLPEDFYVAGRETFRGVDCHVLASDRNGFYRTFYVGVADHRLYGLTNAFLPRRSAPARDAARFQLAQEMGFTTTNRKYLDDWLQALPPTDRQHYTAEYSKRMRAFAHPQATHFCSNYKELSPGRWFPMRQGYDIWSDIEAPGEPFVRRTRDTRIISAAVDQPLPDAAFAWDFTEGVDVFDRRPDAPLQYKYKRHFEPAEWAAILDDAAEKKARLRPGADSIEGQLARRSPLGKPAPQLPDGATWINSAPLRLADLKGKTVILEFFASWSKFSQPDVAQLNELHARRDRDDGVTVIAIHPAGTPVEQVRKWVKDNNVTYPVCVDTPAGATPWDGTLFNAYRVMAIPVTFTVNPRGVLRYEGILAGATDLPEKPKAIPDGL
jgi:RNA polymerase sigma factor (sigma-70 family)